MRFFQPPHEPTDAAKLDAMVETIRTGGTLPPVVRIGAIALTGSHRIAAYEKAYKLSNAIADGWENVIVGEIPSVEISDAELRTALASIDCEYPDETDHNTLCEAIYRTTTDDDVRNAIADQRGY